MSGRAAPLSALCTVRPGRLPSGARPAAQRPGRRDQNAESDVNQIDVRDRDGQIAGYLTRFPGTETFATHGVARDEEALRDLIIGMARSSAVELHMLLPTSHAETLRWAMAHGFRLLELDSYMVRGEYQPPIGAWVPPVLLTSIR